MTTGMTFLLSYFKNNSKKAMKTKQFSFSKHIYLSLWYKHLSISSLFNILFKNEMITLTLLDLWRKQSLTVSSLNDSPFQKIITCSFNLHDKQVQWLLCLFPDHQPMLFLLTLQYCYKWNVIECKSVNHIQW